MNDKKLFTIKDLVWFVTLLVGVLSTFFLMQGKLNATMAEVEEIKSTLQNNNLELINYKVGEIAKKQDEFIKAFNTFLERHNNGF